MTLIDKIKAGMEAGTKGPWRAGDRYRSVVSDDNTGYDDNWHVKAFGGHMVCESVKKDANRHRIARVPEMEAALLAAEKLAEMLQPFSDMAGEMFSRNWNDDSVAISLVVKGRTMQLTFKEFSKLRQALTTYRKATGAV